MGMIDASAIPRRNQEKFALDAKKNGLIVR